MLVLRLMFSILMAIGGVWLMAHLFYDPYTELGP